MVQPRALRPLDEPRGRPLGRRGPRRAGRLERCAARDAPQHPPPSIAAPNIPSSTLAALIVLGRRSRCAAALGLAYDFADLADGAYHEVVISYDPNSFDREDKAAAAADDYGGAAKADDDDQKAGDAAVAVDARTGSALLRSLSVTPGLASMLTSAQRGNMRYVGSLAVRLDGAEVLRIPLNLEDVIRLDKGRAYVGFTGATGAAYQEHSVVAWQFNESRTGVLVHPANEHCRVRVPSLWQSVSHKAAPLLPGARALACTPYVLPATVPDGAMRCAEVDASASGVVLCRGHDPAEVVQPWRSYNRASLPDIVATVGVHFRHAFAPDALIDPQSEGRLGVAPRESTAPLVYSVAHSMEWLEFDAPARRLHGTPPRPGTWNVTVTATDPGLAVGDVWHGKARAYLETPLTAVDSFLLHVREVPADASEDYWEADSVARNPQAAGLA